MENLICAAHWQEIEQWPAKWFSPKECADTVTGALRVHVPTLLMMDKLRDALDFPIVVNSWYRTIEHDKAISGSGAHCTGQAIDAGVYGERAYEIIGAAGAVGFTGIGVSQKGDHGSRFIHLDTLDNTPTRPRPWIWSY